MMSLVQAIYLKSVKLCSRLALNHSEQGPHCVSQLEAKHQFVNPFDRNYSATSFSNVRNMKIISLTEALSINLSF